MEPEESQLTEFPITCYLPVLLLAAVWDAKYQLLLLYKISLTLDQRN